MSKWTDALRSGKYKQCKKQLRNAGRHCCLGVLCEVRGYIREGAGSYRNSVTIIDRDMDRDTDLPPEFRGEGYLPFTDRNNAFTSLVMLNDGGLTFSQIADVIEHFYPEVE